ncbi:MAG: hypothetical protein AUK17_01395 [Parcubacteria group bacterium CG2_30_44_18]|nr:MAG: hypothetical protein AUK17_01395 [Parcubacteria group bacterium CG2_30_44_18]
MFGIKIKFEKSPKEEKKAGIEEGLVSGEAEAGKITPKVAFEETAEQKKLGQAWGKIVKWVLYLLVFLTPIFFLPWGVSPVAQNKQFLATALIAIAFIVWLAKTIASGKLVWPKTPVNIAVWFLVIVWAISSFLSMSKYRSIGLVGLEADSLLNIIKYALAFFLVAATFRQSSRQAFGDRGEEKKGEENKIVYAFLSSVAVLAIFTGLTLANINFLPWDFTKTIDFNTVGTTNALALFLGAGLMLAVGIMTSNDSEIRDSQEKINKKGALVKWGICSLAIIIAIELVLINFNFVWWSLIGAMLFFSAYVFAREAQAVRGGAKQAPRIQKLIFPLVVLGVSVILLLVRTPVFFQFSQEVRPTNQATYDISKEVLKSGGIATDLFGSGPGTFTFDYGLYRGPVNNQNAIEKLFWGVRFNQGFSFASTALATAGVLGVLALALLILSFLWQVFRKSDLLSEAPSTGASTELSRMSSGQAPSTGASTELSRMSSGQAPGNAGALRATFISVVVYFFVSWFLYPANFSLLMFSFVALGLLMAANVAGGKMEERNISLIASPQRTMIVSLLLIVLMIGSVSLLYVESQKYVASLYFSSGLKIFNANQNPDSALVRVGEAINLDPMVDDYQRAASQLFLVKTKNTLDSLQSASGVAAEPLRADFQNNMARAVSFAQQAQILGPSESANWTNLGYVYENVLLFVDGAEGWMTMAYEKAVALEPQNPAPWSDLGRAYLAAADKIQTQLNQMSSAEKPDQTKIDALKQKWNEDVAKSIDALSRAVQIKPDYSLAHLLLAQAYTRQGDIKNAIQKSFDYYSLNPTDAGAAFQLGFLFYKDSQMANARAALERAVELSADYSNARYFLGLVYDTQGNKDMAKEQFAKIAELNPDNQEVKEILGNLNAGRGALETIVPPAMSPDQRTQAPVPETGGASEQSIK